MGQRRSERRREIEVERQRAQLEGERKEREDMARLRADMDAAREEFARAVGVEALNKARKYRDRFGEWPTLRGRKRRPRRGLEGGEPVPVKPRPKPTPLVDGAEAPIE